jgi:hypothetical protein
MVILGLTAGFAVILMAGLWFLLPRLLQEDTTYRYVMDHGPEQEELNRPQSARAARA